MLISEKVAVRNVLRDYAWKYMTASEQFIPDAEAASMYLNQFIGAAAIARRLEVDYKDIMREYGIIYDGS